MHACGERATLTYAGPRPPTCDYRCSLRFQKPLGCPMLLEGAWSSRLTPLLGSPYTLMPLEEGQWGCAQTALGTNDHIQPDLWPLWWPLRGLAALAHQPFGAVPLSPLHTLLHLPGLCSARPQLGPHQAQGRSSGIWGPGGAWQQQGSPGGPSTYQQESSPSPPPGRCSQ